MQLDEELISRAVNAAFRVHRELGLGLLESVYEKALVYELSCKGIASKRQVEVPAVYKGKDLGLGFRADIVVEECLLLEIKTVDKIIDIHTAQIITYLRLLQIKRGFILNFNEKLLKNGIKRISI